MFRSFVEHQTSGHWSPPGAVSDRDLRERASQILSEAARPLIRAPARPVRRPWGYPHSGRLVSTLAWRDAGGDDRLMRTFVEA